MDLKTWNSYLEELAHPEFVDTSSLEQQTELDSQVWDGDKLNPEIADRLYLIAKEFFQSLRLDSNIMIKDVILTGSLASYNWSEYSDIDIHILIDFKKLSNIDLYVDYFRQKAMNWNRIHDIFIKGYEVELYIQDTNEPHQALGIYSLMSNRFIKMPSKYSGKIDYKKIKQKASDLMDQIDEVYDLYAEKAFKRSKILGDHVADKIKKYRKVGLQTGGVYSIENLVFKVLRRNDYIKKLYTLRTKAYDSEMSINDGMLQEAVSASGARTYLNRINRNFGQEFVNDIAGELNAHPSVVKAFMAIESGGRSPKAQNWDGGTQGMPIFLFMIRDHFIKHYKKKFPGRPLPEWAHKEHSPSKRIWAEAKSLWKQGAYAWTSWGLFQIHPFFGRARAWGYRNPEEMALAITKSPEAQVRALIKFVRTTRGGKLLTAIQNMDWRKMAGYYNGDWTGRYANNMKAIYDADKGFSPDREEAEKAKDGSQIYILGDSNTITHKGYWKSWAKKNSPASKINFNAINGAGISKITQQLNKIDPTTAKTIVIGSLGGNDAQGLKDGNFAAELSPDGNYYKSKIMPLMQKLKDLQDSGVEIGFFGLPFGRSNKPSPNDRREMARGAMDAALSIAANSFGIPYQSVFEDTKAIKGQKGGVHYSGKGRKAYRDLLASRGFGEQPSSREEIAYAKGGSGTSLKAGRSGRFLSNYKNIGSGGLTFNRFYADLNAVLGAKNIGKGKTFLKVYGKDKIFGPEHYAALEALANESQNQFYLSLINVKERTKQDKEMAKAEEKAEISIEKELSEQTKPYQRAVKKGYRKMKMRLLATGPNTYNVGGKMKKPSYKRSKSAPAGFGGS